jgi:phytanoyl-CoA hydroxylase
MVGSTERMPSLLTDAEVEQFRREGWATVRHGIDEDTLTSARNAIVAAWESRRAEAFRKDAGLAAFDRVRPELPRMHRESPVLAAFVRARQLAELAGQLLGPDVDLNWNQAHVKEGGGDARTAIPWHQDGHYAAFEGTPPFSCWVALTHATIENGAMWGAPNPDRAIFSHVWDEALEYFRCEVDEAGAFPLEVEVGQALLFDTRFPHRSLPNVSDRPRIGYSLSFAPAGARRAGSGKTFGDGVPVLRGGVWIEELFADLAVKASRGAPSPAHPALDVLRGIGARAPSSRATAQARLDAYLRAASDGDDESTRGALSALLVPPSDEARVMGDLVGARAHVGQVLHEANAAYKRGNLAEARLLLERAIELDPSHEGARRALGAVKARSGGARPGG